MIIIAESGATKIEWVAVGQGLGPVKVRTAGINLASMPEEAVEAIAKEAAGEFAKKGIGPGVDEIHFYAAGLITSPGVPVPEQAIGLDKVLRSFYPGAVIEYASDLLDAARAVCGDKPGIAAILGTGSNSCFYDGEKIVKNVRSAGFILGDEGGGARLGKLFMSDFLKGLVPEPVAGEFASEFEVDYLTVVKNVYKGDAPSRYLGSFAPWIMARYESSEYVRNLAEGNFRDFIERALKQYDLEHFPVGVIGGFGHAYEKVLRKVSEPYGIHFSKIISSSLEGLVDYHQGRF
ncbi:MAG: hypothetical protein IJK73_06170 [Bacteroidales bacterium]|nr:hypothetical protein [Bacteroidales bacterium]